MQNPLQKNAALFREKNGLLQEWFQKKAHGLKMPITTSVDIRNAGFKISVVDTNVFPAGFNNLCPHFSRVASQEFKKYFEKYAPHAKKIIIIPEKFTRNLNYFSHIKKLEDLFSQAGFQVSIGFLDDLSEDPLVISLPDGATLKIEKLKREGSKLKTASADADVIFLSNDCSNGIPPILQNISQPLFPSPELGWHNRSKKHHFEIYCQLIAEMAKILNLDCFFFCPITFCEREVHLDQPKDLERVAKKVDEALEKISKKYKQYGISEKPYVFVKNNAGTFGLGMVHVESGEEIINLNRKERQKLGASKGGRETTEFLIQEGVITIDSFNGFPVEPILYFVGGELVGGFFRLHEAKDNRSSLNAPGAQFKTLCIHESEKQIGKALDLHCQTFEDFFVITNWLGKVATLAVALEEKELQSA